MPVKILYTGSVEKEFIVNDNEIQIDYEPLIDIQFSNDRSVLNQLRELEMQKAFVVVTSQNALAFLKKNVTTKGRTALYKIVRDRINEKIIEMWENLQTSGQIAATDLPDAA